MFSSQRLSSDNFPENYHGQEFLFDTAKAFKKNVVFIFIVSVSVDFKIIFAESECWNFQLVKKQSV